MTEALSSISAEREASELKGASSEAGKLIARKASLLGLAIAGRAAFPYRASV